MIRGRSVLKLIKGVVFNDSNHNGTQDEGEAGLENINIRLYLVEEISKNTIIGRSENVKIYNKKLISSTKTAANGEYRFYVYDGNYSVSMDIDTLPDGKGVSHEEIQVPRLPVGNLNFIIRDVAHIEMGKDLNLVRYIGEDFSPAPVLKDKIGTILSSRLIYSTDSDEVSLDSERFLMSHKTFKDKKVNIGIKSGAVSAQVSLDFKIPDVNPIEKIKLAHRSGIINEDRKILLYLDSLFQRGKLSREYDSNKLVKSGTTAVEEIHKYIRSAAANKDVASRAERYMADPLPKLDRVYTSPGGFFKVHYTLNGPNAVAKEDKNRNRIPDYIEDTGNSFDYVKTVTCDTRGFKVPLLDEGKSVFDIYVYDLKGKYGITFPSKIYTANDSRTVSASYISIDNSFSSSKGFKKCRTDCMKVTAAHEFFHAVQNSYNFEAESWWKEASATWNEDEVYDEVNDYFQYLDSLFAAPERSLEQNSYGGVAFAKCISENWGGYETIKRILEIHSNGINSSISAIDKAVKEKYRDAGIGSIYNMYTAYNFNPAQYYREGPLWKPTVTLKNTYSVYPVEKRGEKLNHLAATYNLFNSMSSEEDKTLKISIAGSKDFDWGFKIQKRKRSDNLCDITAISMARGNDGLEILCENFGKVYKELCLIPANLEESRDGAQYDYSAFVQ